MDQSEHDQNCEDSFSTVMKAIASYKSWKQRNDQQRF